MCKVTAALQTQTGNFIMYIKYQNGSMPSENVDPLFIILQTCDIDFCYFKKFVFLHHFTQTRSSWRKETGLVWNPGGWVLPSMENQCENIGRTKELTRSFLRGFCGCFWGAAATAHLFKSAFWIHVDAVRFGNDGWLCVQTEIKHKLTLRWNNLHRLLCFVGGISLTWPTKNWITKRTSALSE